MKYLILAVLGSGCIITSDDSATYCGDGILDPGESCDDGNNVDGDGCSARCELEVTPHHTTATWTFVTSAGAPSTACSSTFDTAFVVSQKVDASGNPIGTCGPGAAASESCYVDPFPCTAGSGTTQPIPNTALFPMATGGRFLTYVAIGNGTQVFAETLGDIEDLTSQDQTYPSDATQEHGTIYSDGGRFQIAWSLVDGNHAPITCSAAMVGSIGVTATLGGSASPIQLPPFRCDQQIAITTGLLAGGWALSVISLDALGTATIGQPTTLTGQIHAPGTCATPDCVTDLAAITLDVDSH
jgi:cysteine-rich repeat protein